MSEPEKILRSTIELGDITKNIVTMLKERSERFKTRPLYRQKQGRTYRVLSAGDLYRLVGNVGCALMELGLTKGDVVAVYSRNREEMLVLELAAMSMGAIACPIFSEYPARQLDYVLEHSGARILAISDAVHLEEALGAGHCRHLEKIFLMDWTDSDKENAAPFQALYKEPKIDLRRRFEEAASQVNSNDPCLMMYTSGTTGRPKGALLSHRNILSQRKAMELLWNLGPHDRFLSYLPWHHSFGGIFEFFGALYSGACLTLDESYGKNVPLLIENFKSVRPTVYFSVPSVYQALVAEAKKSRKLEDEIFHPELKFVFTAAAPLPRHLSDFFEEKGIPVVEGWGLTETSPCVTVTSLAAKRKHGVVGHPIPGVEVKLACNGEILVRGPNVMLGYHKDPALNSKVLEPDGWFHTGDFGEISEDGLVLKCRLDGMFKLTTGQMVISQAVENALIANPLIKYAVVFGSGESFVGAVVFPDKNALSVKETARKDIPALEDDGLDDGKIKKILKLEVEKACAVVPEKYARPQAFIVAKEEPSLANGQLTPTMKIVRSKVMENYAPYIKAIFNPQGASVNIEEEVIRI
ncbi:MAG: AMP-binding protein [Elusimicrobia bacterium]|nr:AMP-binding protein [Elusimicrobiota bacterium]